MDYLSMGLFLIGLISSFVVGGNNAATALGILISTNALKRKYSYLLSSISMFLGVSLGGLSMEKSIYGTVNGQGIYLQLAVFSVFFASVISFYYLNKMGIPSSLSVLGCVSLALQTTPVRLEQILVHRGILVFLSSPCHTLLPWSLPPAGKTH
jgi:PiT family inorganic phosphate transporter